MIRPTLLGLAAATALTALPAAAFDIEAMTDDERMAFRAEIREYLLENPEVLMEAIQVLEGREQDAAAAGDQELVAENADAIFEDGVSWVGGNPDGDVTIVEFMDYRCGYCKKAFPEVAELIESDGNIRFVVKEFPILGEESVLASRFAVAVQRVAGDDAYEAVHDRLMEGRAPVTEEALQTLAEDEGIDWEAVAVEMQAPETDEVLAANHALAQSLGIQGTPTFVVGDRMIRGYMPVDAMRAVVDEVRPEEG